MLMAPRVSPAAVLRSALVLFMLLFGASNSDAMKYHDNVVKMPLSANGYTIVSATYTVKDWMITAGQDPDRNIYEGYSQAYAGNKGSMTFRLGQSLSTEAGSWFAKNIPASRNTFDETADKLYFALLGTLRITLTGGKLGTNRDTYTIDNIAFGMGWDTLASNWWFGGKTCTYAPDEAKNTVRCTGKSSAQYDVDFYFRRGGNGNGVDTVELTKINYPFYQVFPMRAGYIGESVACVWQNDGTKGKCPPYVVYYDAVQARTVRLKVMNNLLYNADNQLFDTTGADLSHSQRAAIFVMSWNGDILASNQNVVRLFHHSTMLAGAGVASAGELVASQGIIQEMTNCSGHYRPTDVAYQQLLESLHQQGYTRSFRFRSCRAEDIKY